MSAAYERLREHVFGLQIIDTHEHLPAYEQDRPGQNDVLSEYLSHYFSCDLVSAGLSPKGLAEAKDSSKPLAQRWRLVEPFWAVARNTGYGRSLDIAARDLYGVSRIDGATIEPLNEAFVATRGGGQTYQTVLKEKSGIRTSILDASGGATCRCDRRFFSPVFRLDKFIMVDNVGQLRAIAAQVGMPGIHCLADLERACELALDAALKEGAFGLKSGLAYHRPLCYQKTTAAAAEAELVGLFSSENNPCMEQAFRGTSGRPLQDYMMHFVLRLADNRGLAFQFHTGLQEGNGNYIAHSDPAQLTNLFMEYPNVRFDLFHIGYPYQQTVAALAKNFRNVFIDFCWAHIISPTASVNALIEYLDSVPANKISGFGGDYVFVDGVYGHQHMARENIARALAAKVEQGAFDEARAREIAGMLLYDNPKAIFGLKLD